MTYTYRQSRAAGFGLSRTYWFYRISLFLRMFKNINTSRVLESAKKVGGGGGREREREKKKKEYAAWENTCYLRTFH